MLKSRGQTPPPPMQTVRIPFQNGIDPRTQAPMQTGHVRFVNGVDPRAQAAMPRPAQQGIDPAAMRSNLMRFYSRQRTPRTPTMGIVEALMGRY